MMAERARELKPPLLGVGLRPAKFCTELILLTFLGGRGCVWTWSSGARSPNW